jgi:ubiquinol-cytochrome c reductase iron-sulfur subunit
METGPGRPRPHASPKAIERGIGLSLLVSAACSVGLTVTYVLGGQPQIEGGLLGGSLGGLAVGLVLWGKRLTPVDSFVEERELLEPPVAERTLFEEELAAGEAQLTRRTFLTRMLVAAAGALGVALLFPIRSLGPRPGTSLVRTAWSPGARVVRSDGRPVTVDDLAPGGVLTVFPEGHTDAADSQAILIRAAAGQIRPLPGRAGWSPDGYVAYSKICTHAGCPVGLYEQRTGHLFCPCHQSVFDALDGAAPIGGPATRPLPQLPLMADATGNLRARSDFPEAVGPEWWSIDRSRPGSGA